MFSNQTYEVIKQRILDNINIDIDKREGSFTSNMVSPLAEELAKAYINSKSANELELQENEIVSLKSKNGQIRVEIIIDDSINDYVVMMYVGWWEKHGNPNYLTNSGMSDIGGQITYNETFVNIIK